MKKKLFILMVSVVTAFSMSAVVAFADDAATADVAEPAAVEEVVEEEAVEEKAEVKEEAAVGDENADAETPAADEAAPAADEAAPAADEAAPAADDAAPAADDAAPAADDAAPAADDAAPAADDAAPAADDAAPADGTDATTPADGTDATTPADGTDATTPADGTDATTPADGTDPASQVDPNATANQKVFIEFVDLPNARERDDTVRSHVDSRSATEKEVNYYVVGTTSTTSGNDAVYYTAYLTFAKWALKDTDGNTLMTSEDVDTWSWDLDITGITAESPTNAINWDIKKEFQKSELVEQSYRYLYNTNLFKNGMAENTKSTKGSTNMSANKVILNIDHNGTRYSVDMTDKDNPFYFLYHTNVCNAFGFVTSQQSKEIKIGTAPAPAPQTTEPSCEPKCEKTFAKHYWKCAKKVKQCDVPKTGDAQMSYEVLAALVLMIGGALVLTEKKRRAI